jgi:hypothetical protein
MATSRPFKTRTLALSVLGAVVIWLFNELNKDGYTLKVNYPVELTYNDSLYIPVAPLPKKITAILNGTGWELLRKSFAFTVSPVVYELTDPLRNRTLNTASLAAMMSEQVKDVTINSVVADTVNLEFDRFMTKTAVLRLDSLGVDLEKRFVISSFVNLNPQTVTFKGPALLVDNLKDTILIKVPAKRIRANYDEDLPIKYPRSSLVKASAERVFVSFEVAELLRPLAEPTPQNAAATKSIKKKKG